MNLNYWTEVSMVLCFVLLVIFFQTRDCIANTLMNLINTNKAMQIINTVKINSLEIIKQYKINNTVMYMLDEK
jgi:hypothetical protein